MKKRRFSKKGSIRIKSQKSKLWLLLSLLAALLVLAALVWIFFFSHKEEPITRPALSDMIDAPISSIEKNAEDKSAAQKEAIIKQTSINDPVMWGEEIIYASTGGSASFNKMYVYNTAEKTSETLPLQAKYNNFIWMQMNETYLVYLDSSPAGGGRICVYDRQAETSYVIKEYTYAVPQLSLDGEYVAFLQQAGDEIDRLYLYNLRTRESVTVKVMTRTPAVSGGVSLNKGILTYAVSYYEGEVLKSRVTTLDITTGEEQIYEWDRYIYAPKQTDHYVAFSTSSIGITEDIYICELTGGDTPYLLMEDVVNYEVGDGFLAYTKNDAVYIYKFATAKTYRLNTSVSKGLLASVMGKHVCWYDVTSPGDVDVVKYVVVDW
ncbi:MAG: hypothetical protein ACOX3W_07425 [Christensenellaceae bacterium]|jgi:hypothetical protein